jgi:biotin carboxyl carrier protein
MSWISFEHEGKRCRFSVARTTTGVWIGWPGRSLLFGTELSKALRTITVERTIRAPMTGRVVKVPGKVGNSVKANDVLVVLDAMKMEYRLVAPRDGIVETVSCNVGDLVQLGRTLVMLAP